MNWGRGVPLIGMYCSCAACALMLSSYYMFAPSTRFWLWISLSIISQLLNSFPPSIEFHLESLCTSVGGGWVITIALLTRVSHPPQHWGLRRFVSSMLYWAVPLTAKAITPATYPQLSFITYWACMPKFPSIVFVVASSLQCQATNTHKHTIFAGPFVTSIIQSMGFFRCLHRMTPVGGQNPFTLCSLQKMGIATP